LSLEEKRLELLPDKRGELLPLYESLLAVAEAAGHGEGKGEGGKEEDGEGEGEGGDEWLAQAVAPQGLPQLVEIRLACGPFPLDWPAVVAAAKRVLAVAASAAAVAAAAAALGADGCVFVYNKYIRRVSPSPHHHPIIPSPSHTHQITAAPTPLLPSLRRRPRRGS
jgi:hypothetical protein